MISESVLDSIFELEESDDQPAITPAPTPEATAGAIPAAPPVVEPKTSAEILAELIDTFRAETIYHDNDIFTAPVLTTGTMEGYIKNVSFHEEKLIQIVRPDENVVMYRCNYGKVIYHGYSEPVPVKKTNRGRKKKIKVKKNRKKQGAGTDFNSQITFVVPTQLRPVSPVVDPHTRVYKFKVFRTGKIQMPGARSVTIDDVVDCCEVVVDTLNAYLHYDSPPEEQAKLERLQLVMKNYKFIVRLDEHYIIDLTLLYEILSRARDAGSPAARIFNVVYTRQLSKLSVRFLTPLKHAPHKCTLVNIFMSGKINILGAFSAADSYRICDYLYNVFAENRAALIVREGVPRARPAQIVEYGPHLPPMNAEEEAEWLYLLEHWDMAHLEAEPVYDLFMDLVNAEYAELERLALEELSTLFV